MTTTLTTDILTNTISDKLGTMDVYLCGSVKRGKTTFNVKRLVFRDWEGVENNRETHLIGVRGAEYLLRKFIGDDTGARQMISLNSGAEYRVQGNRIKVIEVAGVIEFLN